MSRERRCFSCGYPLTGIKPGEPCPECGLPAYDKYEVLDPQAVKRRRVAILAALIVVAAFIASCGMCSGVLNIRW